VLKFKHYLPEETVGQNRNPKGNEKLSCDKQKWKHNVWNSAKAELRGKFISVKAYIRKRKLSLINSVTRSRKRATYEAHHFIVSKLFISP
jgi:hypothetical protein